ncbi:MAG: hypothetical protein V9G24_16345 [Rhodoblastus sp.]
MLEMITFGAYTALSGFTFCDDQPAAHDWRGLSRVGIAGLGQFTSSLFYRPLVRQK